MSRLITITAIISGISIALWLAWPHRPNSTATSSSAARTASTDQPDADLNNKGSSRPNTQIATTSLSETEIREEVTRRDRSDSKWEWKTPISFYGKVVDETLAPISNASVHFEWTNLSPRGTSEANTSSDSQGLFSLGGVKGKRLLVRVTKQGYYNSDSRNRESFEFANPFEEIYYRPDTTSPVLFHLRKKGAGVQLIKKSVEVMLPSDGSGASIDLATGKLSQGGQMEIQAWKPWPPRPLSPHYDWKVLFTISDGGFIEAPAEFAFEAPEAVYSQPFEVNMPAKAGDAWRVSAEKTLYFAFGQPRKYGRLHFRTDGTSRYVFLDYVFNPSGSKNLEEASADRTSP
jgi:hypothetical protein